MSSTYYLACDLGAESGRLMLGALENDRLSLEELHRFPNTPVASGDSLHWNWTALVAGLREGMRLAAARNVPIASISTDSWGVDYVLFDAAGRAMEPVFHYRDARCQRGVEAVYSKVDWNTVFSETGIQFMSLNTLFQLGAESPDRLRSAGALLGVGDAFNCLLSGVAVSEVSMASTTQLYNPVSREWSGRLLSALDLPRAIFPRIVPSGTILGSLRGEFQIPGSSGLASTRVVASCSHDTGAAVAAVPAQGDRWAYLSSGTWSLMGVEVAEPNLTPACRDLNFTNEIGFGNSVRLLKNIVGLWIVQECKRFWGQSGSDFTYAQLAEAAAGAPAFKCLINPTDPRFLSPGRMPQKIEAFCAETQQPIPATVGEVVRGVLESLALVYAHTLSQLEQVLGHRIERLHIVGGGSRNELLNQFTANALQIPVLAGPEEATAAGNVLIQAIAMGHLKDLAHAREVVRASHPCKTYQPKDAAEWQSALRRFRGWL